MKLLVGRLVWTPTRDAAGARYAYAAEVSYARVLVGIVGVNGMVPPGKLAWCGMDSIQGRFWSQAT